MQKILINLNEGVVRLLNFITDPTDHSDFFILHESNVCLVWSSFQVLSQYLWRPKHNWFSVWHSLISVLKKDDKMTMYVFILLIISKHCRVVGQFYWVDHLYSIQHSVKCHSDSVKGILLFTMEPSSLFLLLDPEKWSSLLDMLSLHIYYHGWSFWHDDDGLQILKI